MERNITNTKRKYTRLSPGESLGTRLRLWYIKLLNIYVVNLKAGERVCPGRRLVITHQGYLHLFKHTV